MPSRGKRGEDRCETWAARKAVIGGVDVRISERANPFRAIRATEVAAALCAESVVIDVSGHARVVGVVLAGRARELENHSTRAWF